MTLAIAIFTALAKIPSIMQYCEDFAAGISLWYIQRQNNATLQAISDSAALALAAKTDADRMAAAASWAAALSNNRVSSS